MQWIELVRELYEPWGRACGAGGADGGDGGGGARRQIRRAFSTQHLQHTRCSAISEKSTFMHWRECTHCVSSAHGTVRTRLGDCVVEAPEELGVLTLVDAGRPDIRKPACGIRERCGRCRG
jgi:hypothetical protein